MDGAFIIACFFIALIFMFCFVYYIVRLSYEAKERIRQTKYQRKVKKIREDRKNHFHEYNVDLSK